MTVAKGLEQGAMLRSKEEVNAWNDEAYLEERINTGFC